MRRCFQAESIMQTCRLYKACGIHTLVVLAAAAFLAIAAARSLAQEPIPPAQPEQPRAGERPAQSRASERPSIGGFQALHDVVPQRPPRPSSGEWQFPQNDAPVSKFIETLKGN